MSTSIDPNNPKYTQEFFNELATKGSTNVKCQNALLLFLFHHFPQLELKAAPDSYDLFRCIYYRCNAENYELNSNDFTTNADIKAQYIRFFSIINALYERGLVERYVQLRHYLSSPKNLYHRVRLLSGEIGDSDWDRRRLCKFDVDYLSDVMAREFLEGKVACVDNNDSIYFDSVEIVLTPKGYDVALTFQEHQDQEKRFSKQQDISESASKSARSSATTARIALFAAFLVAAGSLGNLAYNLGLLDFLSKGNSNHSTIAPELSTLKISS